MKELSVAISVVGLLGSISSIVFAFLAFKRNEKKEDKKEIGVQCCNCGSTEELEYHHIVPVSLDGKNINSNMACLCYPCH